MKRKPTKAREAVFEVRLMYGNTIALVNDESLQRFECWWPALRAALGLRRNAKLPARVRITVERVEDE